MSEYHRAWRKANKEKCRRAEAKWRSLNKDAIRNHKLKMRYGISLLDYQRLFDEQNGQCAICGKDGPSRNGSQNLSVDHDHHTGQVRGLLCQKCNSAIGFLDDKEDRILMTLSYLKKYKEIVQ